MSRFSVRLTLAFLVLTWLAIGALAFVLRDTIEGGFREYVRGQDAASVPEFLPTALESYFVDMGTWQGAESLFPGRGAGGSGSGGDGNSGDGSGGGGNSNNPERRGGTQGRQYFVVDLSKQIVASSDPALIGQPLADDIFQYALPLKSENQAIGWLAWQTPSQQRFGVAEEAFLNDMTRALLAVGGLVGALALAVGVGLGWQLTRPLGQLTLAVQGLSKGQRGHQVALAGSREIKQLAFAFNDMSAALDRSEEARQRIAADVAHELRTPVTVLSGHLEGMLDDVLPNSKDQIAIAYDQTLHLKRLVEELRLLTLAEIRQLPLDKRAINLTEFLNGVYGAFEPLALDQDIRLEQDAPVSLPTLHADEGRLRQIFGNLLTNALRHTPDEGKIRLAAIAKPDRVVFRVSNSGSSLSAENAARLFDPFWRADDARDRDRGGSGLGLAIAKRLVELHDGSIRVETSNADTTFIIELPYGDATGGAVASQERK